MADFTPDGSLRDIYVLDATIADWEGVLEHIHRRYQGMTFTIGETPLSGTRLMTRVNITVSASRNPVSCTSLSIKALAVSCLPGALAWANL